jgi:hypothetical protein
LPDLDQADLAYEAIRSDDTDIARIAQNIGCKAASIQKIKDHLFLASHLLDRYVSHGIPAECRRFDSDIRIAAAWRRLSEGTIMLRDLQLLRHEAAEAWYMRRHGPSYSMAHDAAERRFPAPRYSEPDFRRPVALQSVPDARNAE